MLPKNSEMSKAIDKALENKDFRKRAVNTMQAVVEEAQKNSSKHKRSQFEDDSIKNLEGVLEKTRKLSFFAWKNMFFPTLPRILQDFWVFLEISFAIFLFVLKCLEFSTGFKPVFYILSMFLACLDLLLATVDCLVYFMTTSVWVTRFRNKFQIFPEGSGKAKKKWVKQLSEWFEVVRSIASEFLLYPLIVTSIMGFIYDKIYGRSSLSTETGRRDFSLFIISSVYLLISVHVMRLVFVIQTIKTLISMPVRATVDKDEYVYLNAQFGITGVLQIVTSIVIVLAVGVKIGQEEQLSTDDSVHISPFLWCAMIIGWYLPILGVVCFFCVNYYWIQEYSMSYFLDLVSMLQGESFAAAVFGGELECAAEEKALELSDLIGFTAAKENLQKYKESPSNSMGRKLLYPLRKPLLVLMGFLYNISFLIFIFCLFAHYDNQTGGLNFLLFEDIPYGTTLFVLALVAFICNLQAMLSVFYWFLVALGFPFVVAFALMWQAAGCFKGDKGKTAHILKHYVSLFTGATPTPTQQHTIMYN